MLYFDTLPKILTRDQNGNYIAMTNLLTRATLLEKLQNNPMLFYKYSVQDGDTPEIIADKYYGDSYRYWIILYSNQILDPVWQWPLEYNQFLSYIDAKYKTVAETENKTPFEYVTSTVYAYQKTISTTDNETLQTTTEIINIDQTTYNSLTQSTHSYTLPNGTSCEVTVDKNIQYIYDYEYALNESRREIKIMDSAFALQMEEQLKSVMGT